MKVKLLLFIGCCLLLFSSTTGQSCDDTLMVAFYNVENLFHPSNDSLTNDDDFTPTGLYHWSYKKYFRKINHIAKVIVAMGEGNPPVLIGLAEIENEQVLKDLCYRSPLSKYGYRYVHHDSPDRRGVDVALLYRDSCVKILREKQVPVVFPFEPDTRNRDLLYVCAQFSNGDSLHILVNHWTSRYGGYAATIPKRNYYATFARNFVDSLLDACPTAYVLLMGDFNDYCTDESMTQYLRARPFSPQASEDTIYNLMFYFENLPNVGSHKHEDFWRCLDQIIVSNSLVHESNSLHVMGPQPYIFQADFLLVSDEKYGGMKTYRTNLGPRYVGGFSDHLPVYVLLRTTSESP